MNSIRHLNAILIVRGLFLLAAPAAVFSATDGERGDLRILFYNVENYFDTVDNPLTRDGEFTPDSEKRWNGYKFREKTMHIFQVIAAVGEMRPPEIIGLSEVENDTVLRSLLWSTGLSKFSYKILHFESPDPRGIDVGMLYRADVLSLWEAEPISVRFPDNPGRRTRDVLYAKFLCNSTDTLHIYVNHWPSRWGGQEQSESSRKHVAAILRQHIDSVLTVDPCATIVIMGDLNDGPADESVQNVLKGSSCPDEPGCADLCNLAESPVAVRAKGTHRYRAHWETYDQILVSGSLLDMETGRLFCSPQMHIADYPFLLEEDKTYGGVKPNRTYYGPVYHGGFSDHLPVFIDIWFK